MRKIAATKVFLPATLPGVESIGLRAERGSVRLWMINSDEVVVAELIVSPEDGWELAQDIITVADKAAGLS